MESSFNCIGILKMEWAVIQFNNRVAAIPDDARAICSLFAIFILASNELIKKVCPVPAGHLVKTIFHLRYLHFVRFCYKLFFVHHSI